MYMHTHMCVHAHTPMDTKTRMHSHRYTGTRPLKFTCQLTTNLGTLVMVVMEIMSSDDDHQSQGEKCSPT